MGDALCGPSNALQSFRKHTQIDRTLQQDRLNGPRHSPTQGFRTHDPRAGSLDAQFLAFENAGPSPLPFEQRQHTSFVPTPEQHQHSTPAPTLNWAADFQNLRVADRPLPAQNFRTEAPLVLSDRPTSGMGGWQNEFMSMQQQGIGEGKQADFSSGAPAPTPQIGYNELSVQNSFRYGQQIAFGQMGQQEHQHGQSYSKDAMDDAGFEQAFNEAFEHAQFMETESEALKVHHPEQQQEPHATSQLDEMITDIRDPSGIKIGSDAIEYNIVRDRGPEHTFDEAHELARVAGQLVQDAARATDTKFKESQFFRLMRMLRDRDVEVRDNHMLLTSGGSYSTYCPLPAATASKNAPFLTTGQRDQQAAFNFPDMNKVYEPNNNTLDHSFDTDQHLMHGDLNASDLHPGGRDYPGQSPRRSHAQFAQMSGAIPDVQTSLEDFPRPSENSSLSSRHQSSTSTNA